MDRYASHHVQDCGLFSLIRTRHWVIDHRPIIVAILDFPLRARGRCQLRLKVNGTLNFDYTFKCRPSLACLLYISSRRSGWQYILQITQLWVVTFWSGSRNFCAVTKRTSFERKWEGEIEKKLVSRKIWSRTKERIWEVLKVIVVVVGQKWLCGRHTNCRDYFRNAGREFCST